MIVYFVLAITLFFNDAYEEVMRKLVDGLRFLRSSDEDWQVPTSSALCQVTPLTLPPATALIRLGDARGSCEMDVHPATQLPPVAKKTQTKTAAARTANASTRAPRPRRVPALPETAGPVTPATSTDLEESADDV